MTECPELAALETGALPANLRVHVESCESCRLVLELFELRVAGDVYQCLRFEALLAARADGTIGRAAANLLERHLASCAACREIAETLAPTADVEGDLRALPEVDPASYALGLEIARGGMGRILAARDLRVGRPVAVKELLGRSHQLAARFEREARVTARLQHPGIIPIYEIGRWPDGTPFYSMRMVDGRTLREALGSASSLAARLALLPAVISASEAIAFAHARRVIHRDLTPSNVLVGAYGETVVIDWGLAKDFSDPVDDVVGGPYRTDPQRSELTGAGAVIGTAAYMPPEQANAEPVDDRADVYALGAILYHLLAGAAPYRARGSDELLREVKAGPPPAVERLAPGAPRDLVSIVEKAMARDPDDRYPSARELADELKRFQAGRMVEAHAYTTGERMKRFVKRNRAPLAVTGLATILLVAVATAAVTRVVTSRNAAARTVLALLEEEGRVELLAGNSLRAVAYLHASLERGGQSPALRFMLANALREITTADPELLDCGNDIRALTFSPDGSVVVASCRDLAKAWRLADRSELVATFGPVPGGFDRAMYSHDGATVATWGEDGAARLWDVATGTLRRTLRHGADRITSASFTPDDSRVATTGHDGWARIWDAADGTLVREIEGADSVLFRHLYGVLGSDGRLLTVTIEGMGSAWDIETGRRLGGFRHGGFVLGGDLSSDGARAVTCGVDRLVKLWDTRTGQLVWQLAGPSDVVWKCVFSADGTRVLGGDHGGRAHVWDVATGAVIAAVDHGSPILFGRFSHDGGRFLTISGVDGLLKVWDSTTGGQLASHDTLGGREATFSPDGRRLIAARGDGRLRIWHGLGGPLQALFSWRDADRVAAITSDGTRIAIAPLAGPVRVHDSSSGRTITTATIREPIAAATARLAAVSTDGQILVIDALDGRTIATLPVAVPPIGLDISDDGARVAVMFRDRPAEIWDVAGGRRIATLAGAARALLSADGSRAVGWQDGRRPHVWTLGTARSPVQLAVAGRYRPIGFALGGTRIVLLGDPDESRHTVTVWDTETAAPVSTIANAIAEPALDPSGRYLTVVLLDRSVDCLDLATGRHVLLAGEQLQGAQLDPTGSLIAGIAKHGDAVLVVDASDGRRLARWPIAHGPPLVSENGFDAPRASAWWSPDGRTIVTRSTRLAVWHADRDIPADVKRLVQRNVPLRVARTGRLEPMRARLHGTITRGGTPVAGARIAAEYRKPPALGAEPATISRTTTRSHHVKLATNHAGAFERDGLEPGVYNLSISVGAETYTTQLHIGVEARVELELDDLQATPVSTTPGD